MKYPLHAIVLFAALFTSACSQADAPRSASTPAQSATGNCTSEPCVTPANGPARGDTLQSGGKQILETIRHSDVDKKRWQTILHSDSKDKSELELDIVKAANFSMRLDPAAGTLSFITPNTVHTYVVAEPDKPNKPCRTYDIRIVEASGQHALVRQVCPKQEYRAGKFYMSNEYFLYDVASGVARTIWLAAKFREDSSFPSAKPTPALKLVPDGYEFHWVGEFPSDSGSSKMEIHNKYARKRESGKPSLVCMDITDPKRPKTENELCEGTELRRLPASKN